MADPIAEIKSLLDHGRLIIGTAETVKKLRGKHLDKVYLSANCGADTREDITHLAALDNVPIIDLAMNSEELGATCRKPFHIQTLGVAKAHDE